MCHWCKIWNTFSLCIYKFIRLLHYLWMHQTEIYKDLISITFVTLQIWNAWCIGVKTALLWRKWRITLYAVGNNWSSHVASNHFNMQWIYWKGSGKHQHIKHSFLSSVKLISWKGSLFYQIKQLFLVILEKIISLLFKMKFKVTVGTSNIASSILLLFII